MENYSVIKQRDICKNHNLCFFGNAPTLATINNTIDKEASIAWLIPQLTDVAMFSNNQKEMNDCLVEECATIIANEYFYLKTSELMLFFYYFKAGAYCEFYGSVSPLVIMKSLRLFIKDRANAYAKREGEQNLIKAAKNKENSCTYEEYLRLKNK